MEKHSSESIDRAIKAYGQAMHVMDPLRLYLWERRGLTTTHLRLMLVLAWRGDRMLSELASEIQVSPATMTNLIDRLSEMGLVRRRTDEHDRRVIRASLTAEGARAVGEIEAPTHAILVSVFSEMEPETVSRLSRDLVSFTRTARTVIEAAEAI